MENWESQSLIPSERDHPFDQRYSGRCFSCGQGYAGPKGSVMCNLCLNRKKNVDKENSEV